MKKFETPYVRFPYEAVITIMLSVVSCSYILFDNLIDFDVKLFAICPIVSALMLLSKRPIFAALINAGASAGCVSLIYNSYLATLVDYIPAVLLFVGYILAAIPYVSIRIKRIVLILIEIGVILTLYALFDDCSLDAGIIMSCSTIPLFWYAMPSFTVEEIKANKNNSPFVHAYVNCWSDLCDEKQLNKLCQNCYLYYGGFLNEEDFREYQTKQFMKYLEKKK